MLNRFQLNDKQQAELHELQSRAIQENKPECKKITTTFENAEIQKLVDAGIHKTTAKKIVKRLVKKIIPLTHELVGRTMRRTTLAEAIANYSTNPNEAFLDPFSSNTTNYCAKLMMCKNSKEDPTKVLKLYSLKNNTFYRLEGITGSAEEIAKIDSVPDVPEQYTFSSGDDLADNATAADYLIDGLIEKGNGGILAGATGSFKTFVAIHMAGAICTDTDFFGNKVFKTGKVVYINGEGQGGFARRLRAYKLHNKASLENLLILNERINIGNTEQMQRLESAILSVDPVLVIFDTFSSLAGGIKESDNPEVAGVLSLIANTCGGDTAWLVVHHPTKSDDTSIRGAGAFVANSDFVFGLKRDPNSMNTTMSCIKIKDDEEFARINMKAEVVELGFMQKNELKEATSLVLVQGECNGLNAHLSNGLTTKKSKLILRSIEQAIAQQGIETDQAVIDLIDSNTQWLSKPDLMVHIDHVKQALIDIAPEMPDATRRSSLSEGKKELLDKRFIGELDGFLWINKP
jgi:RecA-family ATPase